MSAIMLASLSDYQPKVPPKKRMRFCSPVCDYATERHRSPPEEDSLSTVSDNHVSSFSSPSTPEGGVNKPPLLSEHQQLDIPSEHAENRSQSPISRKIPVRKGCTKDKGQGRSPNCSKCKNHNLIVAVKGHKKDCPFKDCTCNPCQLTSTRRVVMSSQVQLRRTQEKLDKQDKLSSEEGTKKLYDIARRGLKNEAKDASATISSDDSGISSVRSPSCPQLDRDDITNGFINLLNDLVPFEPHRQLYILFDALCNATGNVQKARALVASKVANVNTHSPTSSCSETLPGDNKITVTHDFENKSHQMRGDSRSCKTDRDTPSTSTLNRQQPPFHLAMFPVMSPSSVWPDQNYLQECQMRHFNSPVSVPFHDYMSPLPFHIYPQ